MKPKLLADVHISPITVKDLQSSGYDIKRITDFMPANSSDPEIIALALREKATIVTQDLDFSAHIARSGRNKPSLISLRIGNAQPNRVSSILKIVIPQIEAELQAGAIISVEDTQFRVRKLPI